MVIEGYGAEGELVNGWDALAGNRFLAAHLIGQGFEDDLVLEAFGVDESDARDAYEMISDPDTWPCYQVALRSGGLLSAVRRNYPEDEGVDYLVQASMGEHAITIASLEGSFRGPGISWPELDRATWAMGAANAETRARRLLFMIAMLGDTDAGDEAVAVVRQALSSVGARGNLEELSDALVNSNPMWESPHWVADENGVLVCDGSHSPRNKAGTLALDALELETVSRILAA